MRQSSLFKAGQDAPPTKKVSDMIQTSYAPLFKRNGISMSLMCIWLEGFGIAIAMAFSLAFPI